MTVVTVLPDGRVIAEGSTDLPTVEATDPNPINVTITDLKKVEYVLGINIKTTPHTDWDTFPSRDVKITGNVVGMTLGSTVAGTTINAQAIVVGF